MGLEYDYPEREKACASKPLKVELDGKYVGEIIKVKDGYQYYAKGQKHGGGVFASVPDVQNSLLPMQARAVKGKTPAEDDSPDEIIKQAKAGMKKLKADLGQSELKREKGETLLTAALDLLNWQKDSKEPVDLLVQNINYDGTECDGHTLYDDISDHLGLT